MPENSGINSVALQADHQRNAQRKLLFCLIRVLGQGFILSIGSFCTPKRMSNILNNKPASPCEPTQGLSGCQASLPPRFLVISLPSLPQPRSGRPLLVPLMPLQRLPRLYQLPLHPVHEGHLGVPVCQPSWGAVMGRRDPLFLPLSGMLWLYSSPIYPRPEHRVLFGSCLVGNIHHALLAFCLR